MTRTAAPEGRKETLAYSIKELAEYSSLGEQSIRDAIRDGELVAKRRGKRLFILPDEALRWVESHPDA